MVGRRVGLTLGQRRPDVVPDRVVGGVGRVDQGRGTGGDHAQGGRIGGVGGHRLNAVDPGPRGARDQTHPVPPVAQQLGGLPADRLEAADAGCEPGDLSGRWRTLGETLRRWAISAPHEYALLYGSPVPGYAAPAATIAPSARVSGVPIGLAADLAQDGPRTSALDDFRTLAGVDLSDEVILSAVTAWGGLLGAISLELFGHLHRAVTDEDAHFARVEFCVAGWRPPPPAASPTS